jgi:tetratricopeptide (TPR) repeat protein
MTRRLALLSHFAGARLPTLSVALSRSHYGLHKPDQCPGLDVPWRRENKFVRSPILVFLAFVSGVVSGCSQSDWTSKSTAHTPKAQTNAPAALEASMPTDSQLDSRGKGYTPPTADEMAPMRPEYMAELAKVHEPPEMASKPMQVRKAVSASVVKLGNVMNAVGSPEKATHQQRATAIRVLLEIANNTEQDAGVERVMTYGAIAAIACLDGADPQTIIGYASNAIDDGDDALALRARMYLRAGDRNKALDDLEKIMADGHGQVLVGGGTDPRKDSAPCEWSIADFDALGDDPRALAAKGLYLNSFVGYGAEGRGTVKESTIRDLYARSARSWRSPIPHVLEATADGLGSEHSMAGARCIRANSRTVAVPDIVNACATYDEGIRQEIRDLTMALLVEPTYARALSARADKYLQLAQSSYADGKPSRELFGLAIKDFSAALAADGANQHTLYCDRALALASIGRYQDAVSGYMQGMRHATTGVEDSPFVYEQLADLYTKLGKFNDAADLMTQAIMNASGGGMDAVIFGGGIGALRTLYPEYDPLPDEILAEAVRRRYQPQFPESWDADFISKAGAFKGKVASSILVELYVMRGDAYMKAGRPAEALADYQRVKSNAWLGDEPNLPRHMYFNERGMRNLDLPEPWPPPPPTM